MSTNDLTELREAVARADEAAEGDSNDAEIEALQEALDLALSLVPGYETEPTSDAGPSPALDRPARRKIEVLLRRYKHLGRLIDGTDNPHHPRMSYLLAEEGALRWAIETLTGEKTRTAAEEIDPDADTPYLQAVRDALDTVLADMRLEQSADN